MHSLFDQPDSAAERINDLRSRILRHDHLYYVEARPEISDREYDALFTELQDLERVHPELVTPDSPTQRVGGSPVSQFATVEHSIPMLSLANTYSRAEVEDFDRKVREGLEGALPTYVCELKYDGVAMSLTYQNGVLMQGATRGDGQTGDDVTANVRTIRSIPLRLHNPTMQNATVRGEVYMLNDTFLKINEAAEASGEKAYANPRNLTAGTLKQKDSRQVAKRRLEFVAYWLNTPDIPLRQHSSNIELLHEMGFPTSPALTTCTNVDEVMRFIDEWDERRFGLPFQIDGIVVKVDNLRYQQELGFVARSPRWAIAYKYEARKAETMLEDITLQVGRTGVVTPVAELHPTLLAGSTISRATLHNQDYIDALDLRIGDTVVVEKGGDVIPKVSAVVHHKRKLDSAPWTMPHVCPCPRNSALHRPAGEANWYCNDSLCPWQLRRRLEHFVSRDAMDIDGLGEKAIAQFVDAGLLHSIADIYKLPDHQDEILALDRWAPKSFEKMVHGIAASKKQPYQRVLFALGIRFVGEGVAKVLCKALPSIDLLMSASHDQLTSINEVGDAIAASVRTYFQGAGNQREIEQLRDAGLCFVGQAPLQTSDTFAGMTFVFTGELTTITRKQAEEIVESHGGKASGSVSKKTTYVVAGADAGSKLKKAQELDVQVISESDFLTMAGHSYSS